jgi:hypothetical protein
VSFRKKPSQSTHIKHQEMEKKKKKKKKKKERGLIWQLP